MVQISANVIEVHPDIDGRKGLQQSLGRAKSMGAQPVSRDALRQLKEKHPMIEKKFRGETSVEYSSPTPAPGPIPEWEEPPSRLLCLVVAIAGKRSSCTA